MRKKASPAPFAMVYLRGLVRKCSELFKLVFPHSLGQVRPFADWPGNWPECNLKRSLTKVKANGYRCRMGKRRPRS